MSRCQQQGLVPRIVQEVTNSATVLSLIAVGLGVGFVPGAMRWRLQQGVILRPVADLRVPYRTDIAWRKDAESPLLIRFIETAIGLARRERKQRN
jgi:DNA-binding transcriptional LysR family regulator